MSGSFHSLTHGLSGLELAYGIVFAALLTGLIRGHAPLRHLLLSPVLTVPVILLAALVTALVNPLWRAFGLGPTSVLPALFGMALTAATAYAVGRLLAALAHGALGPLHLRGAIVSAVTSVLGKKQPNGITLAGLPVALADETKHFKLIGTTGTGKSTAIQEILTAALARGDRAIIADPDGGYLRRFYDETRDVILNPFDPDARKWDLFGEITNDFDVEQLARSLIPDSGMQDRIWTEYGRTLFSAIVQQAINADTRSDAELLQLLIDEPVEKLRLMLAGTSAAPFFAEGNEKMLGSIRSVMTSAINTLKYTVRQQATPLSVRQWVRQGAARHAGGRGGVLFIPYKAGEIAALASTISAWMRLGIFEALDQDEGDHRLWFVVDELDALGAIDGLKDALARLRKFGGRCILGFQSIAQVSGTYGKGAAETIVENCGNTLILRCSASERGGTSEFASKLIGQREVLHTTRSKSRRPTDWMASTTSSEQLRIEPAVMASEIERLPDLAGYLKLASIPDWFAVKLTPISEELRPRPRRRSNVTPPSLDPSPPNRPIPDPPTAASPTAAPSIPSASTSSRRSRAPTPDPPTAPRPIPVPSIPTPSTPGPLTAARSVPAISTPDPSISSPATPDPTTSAPSPTSSPTSAPAPRIATRRRKPQTPSPKRKPKRPRQQKATTTPQTDPSPDPIKRERPTSSQIAPPQESLGAVQNPTGGAELRD
jgi:type IV secretory pathway TraG/TraD family ATPase VirD4